MKLGYLSCYVGSDITPFGSLFPEKPVNILTEGFGVDAILLWGGEDIHPSFYGELAHPQNQVWKHAKPSMRDTQEWKAMVYARAHQIPIIGVCRGAQFLCAFAGGRVIQHVTGHGGGSHALMCKTEDGNEWMQCTTCHHQMMYPFDVPHEMLAWMPKPLSKTYASGVEKEECDGTFIEYDMSDKVEPEVVYFPEVRGFAIQGHPEWMTEDGPFVKWCLSSIKSKLFQEETICD